jgi:two-component system, chemotaxis family, CheB/CheR fusion protein
VIEGAVITFIDVSEMKRMKEKLRESEAVRRLAVVVHDAHDAVTVQDFKGRILTWNPAAVRMYGWSEEEALGMNVLALIPKNQQEEALSVLKKLGQTEALKPYRFRRIAKDGRIVEVWLTATALVDNAGNVYAISTTERACDSAKEKEGKSSANREQTHD